MRSLPIALLNTTLLGIICFNQHASAQTGLVAAYSFNEGSGTTVSDSSGNGNTGTIVGATWVTGGKYGDALSFNGAGSYVDLGNPASLQLTGSMTWSAWINAAANPADDGQIISKSDGSAGWELKTSADTGPRTFGVSVSPVVQRYSNTVPALGTWYYVAGVYNASTQTLNIYVNGTLDNGASVGVVPASQLISPVNVNIGRRTGGYYFNGIIDEVRVYSRALSQSEIQTDMNTPLAAAPQSPTAPGNLTATVVGASQINLSWTASASNVGLANYMIEQCQGAGCSNFAQIASVAGGVTTYNKTGLTGNSSYSYRVRALDTANNLGPYSNIVSAATGTPPPTAPGNLTAVTGSATQINLSWTASVSSVGVASYFVQRCQGLGCANFTQVAAAGFTMFNDTGLTAGASYSYQVQAIDFMGTLSGFSNMVTLIAQSPPTTPGNLSATAVSGSQINLSWTASTSGVGVGAYSVQRCQGVGCNIFAQVASVASTTTTYNDTGLTAGSSYSYRVQAIDTAGNLSIYSNVDTATTTIQAGPTAPSNLTATAASGSQINLSWTASTSSVGLASYLIERCQGAGCSSFTQIGSVAGGVTTYNNTGLTAGSGYSYRVRASDTANNLSPYSNVASATTQAGPTTPGNLTATAASATRINLSWTASTSSVGLANYIVQRCQGAGCSNFTQVAAPAGTSFNDTGLTIGASYSYQVQAVDTSGSLSGFSSVASATTQTPPTAPGNLTATAASATRINLNWAASTSSVGLANYIVQRCQGAGCSNFTQVAAPAGTSFNDTGLTTGASYSYQAQAVDTSGNLSGFSSVATAITLTPPTAPGNLTATATSGSQINLSWAASTSVVGLANYIVQRCQGAGCSNFTQVAAPSGTTFNDTGLTAGASYSYQVQAVDTSGNLSGFSNTAGATTLATISGLVAAYSFNEGSGTTVADASGNGNTGTIAGATWVTGGKYGNALSFNGAGSYVDLGNPASLQLTGSMTWSAWINAAANPASDGQIIAKADDTTGWQLKTSPDTGPYTFGAAISPAAQRYSNTVPALNTWYHVAGVYDASAQTLSVYVNGALDNGVLMGAVPASLLNSLYNVNIGRRSGGHYFNGIIDEVRVYNRALSQAEIQTDMNTPLGGSTTQAPTAPGVLTATAVGVSQINLSWTASASTVGLANYMVQRCQGAGCSNFAQIASFTATTTTFSDSGLTPGASYSYQVQAVDTSGAQSGFSSVATAGTQTPPTAPGNLTATAVSATQINLSWTASVSVAGLANYMVQRCQGAGCNNFALVASFGATTTTYNDTGLTAGASYSYRVQTSDTSGNLSAFSAATATTQTPPTAPGNLTATAASATQINLSWTASTSSVGLASYLIEQCQGAGCSNFTQIGSVPGAGTTYNNTGLTAGVTYSYRVRASDTANNLSPYSNGVTATTQTPPTAPGNLTATAASATRINLSWTASTSSVGLANYLIEQCQGAGCSNFTQIGSVAGAVTTYNNTGLTAGASYSYRVRASDTANNLSPYSNGASTTTQTPPTAPGNLTATAASGSQINLSWAASTSVVGLANYIVQRCQGAGCSNFTQVAAPSGTTFNDTGLTAGASYSYQVQAVDTSGNLSGFSNTAGATTLATISGLVAAYSFNEGSGTTVADASGNGNTGTIAGATWVTGGKYGNALSFNGAGSYVDLGNPASLQLTGSMTWSAWINAAANPASDGQIIAKADDTTGWQLKTSPDTGPYTFGAAISPAAQRYSNTVPALNTWYHVAGVYDASAQTLSVYVNGALDNGVLMGAVPASLLNSLYNVNIGRRSGGHYFNGIIDEVRVYNRALSQAEIQTDMNTPLGGSTTQAPTAPGVLTATAVGVSQINLSWTASASTVGLANYMVQRCQGAGCSNFAQIASFTATTTTFSDSGLTPGASYSYQVQAVDTSGAQSGFSSVATAGTQTPPTAPGNLTATAVSATQINLSWTASVSVAGLANYMVQRCQGAGCNNFALVASFGATTTTYNDTGLTAGASYSYRVQASDTSGNLSAFSAATATTQTPPTAPGNLTATAVSATQINLSWTASVSVAGLANYIVQRCQGAGCNNFALVASFGATTTTYNDTGLTAGASYSYRVQASDTSGNLSAFSAATATTQTPPTAPGNLTATAASATQINLSWTASTSSVGLASYLVEQCQGAGCSNFTQIGSVAGAATTYNNTGLTAGASYSYRVRASDTANNLSPYSNGATATTQTPPTAPGNLTATAASGSQINLSWAASTDNIGVTGYMIERCQGAGCANFIQIAAPAGTGTTYSDSGLTPNTPYTYQARATDAAGNLSAYSNTAGATTLATISGLVAAYSFNEGSGTTVADASGNGNTGTIVGASWITAGKYGNALSFDGASSYVDLGNPASLQLTGSMTWSAWINAAANPPDDGQIIAKADDFSGWQFKTSPDTGVRTFGVAVSPAVQTYSNTIPALNTWYYVAGVYDASAQTLNIYVNGTLDNGVSMGAVPASQLMSAVNVNIGRRTGGYYFNGIIDEVRVYNRALSQAEIQTDMNTPLGGTSSNPSTYSISGTVINSGATLTLSGSSSAVTSTDASGNYSFPGLSNGSYVIAPSNAGYFFTPSIASVSINNSSATGVNFTAAAATPHSVSLAWDPTTSQNISGYNLYRATASAGPYAKLNAAPIGTTSYVDSSVSSGFTYFYVATTVQGATESIYSNQTIAVVPTP